MSDSGRTSSWLSIAALALAMSTLVLCAVDEVLFVVDSTGKWIALGVTLLAAGAAVATGWWINASRQATVQRYVDLLCRIGDHRDLANISNDNSLPFPADDSWHRVFVQVRSCILAYNDRLQEADEIKAVAEVRAHRLADEVERLAEILASLPDPVFSVDSYGEVALTNGAARKMFGIEGPRGDGKNATRGPRDERLQEMLLEARRRKAPWQRAAELDLLDVEGRSHSCSVLIRALGVGQDPNDEVGHGAVAILHDNSQLKTIRQRHAEFVSAVSHEMKTPLAGIKAYVELLADGDTEDQETREQFLGVINGQTERLQRLIDNLLNLARIEAGVVVVHKQQQSLNEVLEEAVRVVQPSALEKQIALQSDLSELFLGVQVDRDMILQAAINLLSNAIKYTHPGGRVTLRSRLTEDEVQFEVTDTGVGLSSEDCGKVFEKFYRVKRHKDMAPGTGLGLPLAKHIVEDVHGGKLVVESALGEGSTFRVHLPAANSASPASSIENRPMESKSRSPRSIEA